MSINCDGGSHGKYTMCSDNRRQQVPHDTNGASSILGGALIMWVSAFICILFIFLKRAFKTVQSLDPMKHQGFTLMAGKKGCIET